MNEIKTASGSICGFNPWKFAQLFHQVVCFMVWKFMLLFKPKNFLKSLRYLSVVIVNPAIAWMTSLLFTNWILLDTYAFYLRVDAFILCYLYSNPISHLKMFYTFSIIILLFYFPFNTYLLRIFYLTFFSLLIDIFR